MPLYEYECEACGNRFEQIQKFSDPLVETCPKCGKDSVHKLQSSPAFQFKGSGWYVTDYAKKDSAAPSKTDGTTTEKSDSAEKPAAEKKESTPAKTEAAAPAATAAKDKS
jgi:putative FmdB family regulatory protein